MPHAKYTEPGHAQIETAVITMMPPEQRMERPSSYSVKTHGRSHVSSSGSQTQTTSQSYFGNKSSTPLASPIQPFSVGQAHPPKVSPSASGLGAPATQSVRTPSPNYFGLSIDNAIDPHESAVLPQQNWSPQTSSVRSFGTAIPKHMPLDANPEFEAFRRQADANRSRGFSLSQFHGAVSGTPLPSNPSARRPQPPRWHTTGGVEPTEYSFPRMSSIAAQSVKGGSTTKIQPDGNAAKDSPNVSAGLKRNASSFSVKPPMFLDIGRQESPAGFSMPSPQLLEQRRPQIAKAIDPHSRLSMGHDKPHPPSPGAGYAQRADTVPTRLEPDSAGMMSPGQLEELMEKSPESDLLILDLRVSPQYAQSRIKGALNLCIPTTLLKRATFNLQKLQTTFQGAEEQERFANWQNTHHIVVYDAFSSDKRDALSAQNMIKKFMNEGYSGSMNILRGGFNTFAAKYPGLVDHSSAAPGGTGLALSASGGPGGGPAIAPVIGGVMLPAGSSAPNPFFNNIRQNQDLIGGVGQMKIKLPTALETERLPQWLRTAAEPADQGKKVSEKFLRIELSEQSRMKDAYSIQTNGGEDRVQISGIEKGGKNRYKDILPFEHARVKLGGRPEGVCDYVNASHLQSTRSHKRYIASQGPLPATFEDFWSVIWDQDVRVIVMLTAESEGGQLKCHPYWQGREFGPIKLRPLSEKKVSLDIDKHRFNSTATTDPTSTAQSAHSSVSGLSGAQSHRDSISSTTSQDEASRRRANTTTSLESGSPLSAQPRLSNVSNNSAGEAPYVIIRKLALSHAAHPFAPMREITQLHYPSWPDFGAPAQPSHLLALVELANVMQRAALPLDVPSTIASAVAEDGDETSVTPQKAKMAMETRPMNWHDAPEPGEHVRPMLVHCSAGCGRTGAFCTVDNVIDMLKRQRLEALLRETPSSARRPSQVNRDSEGDVTMMDPIHMSPVAKKVSGNSFFPPSSSPKVVHPSKEDGIDTSWLNDDTLDLIAATVEDFRGQRLSMVQSLRQFVLCYETIIEWVWRVQERDAQGSRTGRGRSGSLIG